MNRRVSNRKGTRERTYAVRAEITGGAHAVLTVRTGEI